MGTPIELPLGTLLDNVRKGADGKDFSIVKGFHVYSDLGLNLPLSAAEEDANARLYLEILQDYASIADVCSRKVNAHVLEIQGTRIHLLLPEDHLNVDSFRRLFAFCISFTRTVYAKIKPKAGEHWDGFCLASDHGPTVLLGSDCGGGSLVSLGPAANKPAKRLGQSPKVKSGHCAVRREVLLSSFDVPGRDTWLDINVLEPAPLVANFSNAALTQSMSGAADEILRQRSRFDRIGFAPSMQFSGGHTLNFDVPVKVRGVCLWSDLDGFTKDVEQAFAAGSQAILQLVIRFRAIMNYPKQFASGIGRAVIELPFAGDCSPLILLTQNGESIADVRKFLTVTAPLKWHEQRDAQDLARVRWSERLGAAKWAVGVACGDVDDGADGVLLLVNIQISQRRFRVASGWGVRRAKDAQEADGVRADDTIMPNTDFKNLRKQYQDSFVELDSRFMVSSYERLAQVDKARRGALTTASSITFPNVVTQIPSVRPYGRED